ncbi:hypothetical protein AB1Y20_003479 [Prymnesium parvum]|uniref:30S ribosomal protein S2, chloroplastic n=1 Tax=Prymnesium parvum TaxID=97485 RepID=A0AB34JEA4_PRYPA
MALLARRLAPLARRAPHRSLCSEPPALTSSPPPPFRTSRPAFLPSPLSAPLPPIQSAFKKVPPKLRRRGWDAVDLQEATSFLGFTLKATHPSSYRSLLGHVGGHTVIDPEETLLAMRKCINLLKKVTFRGGRTLFVSTEPKLARLTRVIGQQTGQFFLAKRWVPGLLTNWEKGRGFVRKQLLMDPRVVAAGRIKQIDLVKANNYKGVENMSRPPDIIVVLDKTDLLGEPGKLNIPVVSVVDTDHSQKAIDYPIIANTNSLRFYHTFAHMLVRAIKEGQSLREDLQKYELPHDAPKKGLRRNSGELE